MGKIVQDEVVSTILSELDGHFDEIVNWRRYLHQHPELSFEEVETAKFIAEKLRSLGLEVKTGIGGNGIVGILTGDQPGKTIAFRADFDALPILDEKEVPYKSQNPGVAHACGHDGHTAALLGTVQTLSKFRKQLKGAIHFIFQHAEEKPPGGAKAMIEAKILDGVDYVFAAHLASDIPVGKVAVGDGVRMASVDKFAITIQGKGGHGAKPHEAIDSIVIGSDLVSALQKIVSRHVNPLQPAVVTIGMFQAGSAFNIIADRAKLEGTVRTFDGNVRKQVEEDIREIVKGITEAFGATYTIDYLHGYPPLYNHPEETAIVRDLLLTRYSAEAVVELEPSLGAEDFAYFLNERPGTYIKVGSRNDQKETQYPHHHPKFDIDERALLHIGKSFVTIAGHYVF